MRITKKSRLISNRYDKAVLKNKFEEYFSQRRRTETQEPIQETLRHVYLDALYPFFLERWNSEIKVHCSFCKTDRYYTYHDKETQKCSRGGFNSPSHCYDRYFSVFLDFCKQTGLPELVMIIDDTIHHS